MWSGEERWKGSFGLGNRRRDGEERRRRGFGEERRRQGLGDEETGRGSPWHLNRRCRSPDSRSPRGRPPSSTRCARPVNRRFSTSTRLLCTALRGAGVGRGRAAVVRWEGDRRGRHHAGGAGAPPPARVLVEQEWFGDFSPPRLSRVFTRYLTRNATQTSRRRCLRTAAPRAHSPIRQRPIQHSLE